MPGRQAEVAGHLHTHASGVDKVGQVSRVALKPQNEVSAQSEVCCSKLLDTPSGCPIAKSVPDEAVTAQIGTDMKGCAIDVNGKAAFRDCKIGDRDCWLAIRGSDWNLLLRMKSVLLEQAEKLQFQRRATPRRIGFQPGTRIVDVTELKRPLPLCHRERREE